MKKTILNCLFVFVSFCTFAQSPIDLTADVALNTPFTFGGTTYDCTGTTCSAFPGTGAFFSTKAQIIAAFNYARRNEEFQMGLAQNSLGNLSLPSTWDAASVNDRALYLVNAERFARAGLSYTGSANVLGLPLQATETNLVNIAQAHTDYLLANNLFSHTGSGGTTPYTRISNSATYGAAGACREFMTYAENIACAGSGFLTYAAEMAIFAWIYQDAGASWGHRRATLIQNTDIYTNSGSASVGYTNNFGVATSEGFLGIGIGTSASYTCAGATGASSHVVVMNIADPKTSCAANYAIASNALPVTLSYLTAIPKPDYVKLNWGTQGETNSSHFVVERSRDLAEFENLGKINSSGNSSEKLEYGFDDNSPLLGISYYRLKEVDFDGSFVYSRPVAVKYDGVKDGDFNVRIYPNPIASGDVVSIKTLGMVNPEIELFDLLGRKMQIEYQMNDGGQGELRFKETPNAGSYILKVSENTKQISKVIVVR
jgi:uncharacterized protein YkwD